MIQQPWVGCEAVAISPGRTSGQRDSRQETQIFEALASTACGTDGCPFAFSPWHTVFLGDSGFAAISQECLYANDIGDASQKVGCSGKTRSNSIAIYNKRTHSVKVVFLCMDRGNLAAHADFPLNESHDMDCVVSHCGLSVFKSPFRYINLFTVCNALDRVTDECAEEVYNHTAPFQ